MAGERTYPILPCRDLDDVLPFYTALGFTTTYRQTRPDPHAVVQREDLALHFFSLDGFDPEQSLGSVVVTVPDVDGLHRAFADGLRAAYGKVPVKGIPRLLRPRRKQGTVRGFSVVDPGGNWLRVSRSGVLDRGLARHSDAPAAEREEALLYRAELAVRIGDQATARAILDKLPGQGAELREQRQDSG